MGFLTLHSSEGGWWCRKRKCSPWQRFTEEALFTRAWEQGHCWLLQLLPQNGWVHHIILDNDSVYPALVLFELQVPVTSGFPPAQGTVMCWRSQWVGRAVNSVQLQREKLVGWGERWQEETQCIWVLCLAGLAETKTFWVLVGLLLQMLKLRW